MRVSIHRNITTNLWVMSGIKSTKNGERKTKVMDKGLTHVSLTDVTFVTCSAVSIKRIQANIANPASRSGREVVAYAVGTLSDSTVTAETKVSWNPMKGADFYESESGKTVTNERFSFVSFNHEMRVTK